jgi:hypothetical protein
MTQKRQKLDILLFQDFLTNEYGFIQQKDRAVCALCCETVVCRTSSVQRHYQTKHQSMFKNSEKKSEAIKRAVSGYKKQTSIFSQVIGTKNKATECSHKIAQRVASKAKPFTDGEFVKATLSSAEILFSDLTN